MAEGAVRPPSRRFLPKAAHSRFESTGSGSGLRANSREDRRFASACISGKPPRLSGAGSLMTRRASPFAGRGRSCPITPSASLVRVLIYFAQSPVRRARSTSCVFTPSSVESTVRV